MSEYHDWKQDGCVWTKNYGDGFTGVVQPSYDPRFMFAYLWDNNWKDKADSIRFNDEKQAMEYADSLHRYLTAVEWSNPAANVYIGRKGKHEAVLTIVFHCQTLWNNELRQHMRAVCTINGVDRSAPEIEAVLDVPAFIEESKKRLEQQLNVYYQEDIKKGRTN